MVNITDIRHKRPDFLKTKFEMEYLLMALACAGLLVIMVVLPFVSTGYGIQRLYFLVTVILSVNFVIGGIVLAKYTKIKPYLIILLILIPYSMFMTGAMYQIFGASASFILNSEGEGYDHEYVHDSESSGAKWLDMNSEKNSDIYVTDYFGKLKLISQASVWPKRIDSSSFFEHKRRLNKGYTYLYYDNVVNRKFGDKSSHNMGEYSDMFIGTSKIYGNSGSEVYKT